MAGELAQSLPESWEVRRLDEVATIIDSLHKTPSYSDVGRPMVRVTDVQGGFLDLSKTLRVSEGVFQEFTRRYAPKKGDMVFSRVGSYGNVSYARTDTPFCLGQNTAIISPHINGRFLHLFLQSADARWQIEQVVVGSTQKTISLKSISALQILIPPPDELEAIAAVLGALDDKIELNRRMNATLESMARALFQSWFVDFDPVRAKLDNRQLTGMDAETAALFPDRFEESELGRVPMGWTVMRLREIAEILSGGTPRKDNQAYWNGSVPWISPKVMIQSHVDDSDECVSEAAIGNGTRLVRRGTVLVMVRGMGLHQGVRISQAQRDVTFNQDVKAVVATKVPDEFIFYGLLNAAGLLLTKVHASGHGTGVLSTEFLDDLQFVVPPASALFELSKPIASLNSRLAANNAETRILGTLRDTLLPKLLNGELNAKFEKGLMQL